LRTRPGAAPGRGSERTRRPARPPSSAARAESPSIRWPAAWSCPCGSARSKPPCTYPVPPFDGAPVWAFGSHGWHRLGAIPAVLLERRQKRLHLPVEVVCVHRVHPVKAAVDARVLELLELLRAGRDGDDRHRDLAVGGL